MKLMTRAIALVLVASISLSGCVVVPQGEDGATRPSPTGTTPLQDLVNVTVVGVLYAVTGIFSLIYWIAVSAESSHHDDHDSSYICSTCGHSPCICSRRSGHSSAHKHKDEDEEKKKKDKRVAPLLKEKP